MDYINIPEMVIPNFITPERLPLAIEFALQHNADANISASQLLFDGTWIVGLQAAKTYEQVSSKMLTKSQIEIRETVAQAYYLVLVAEENKKILDSTLATINNTLGQTKAFLPNGFVEETDVDQLQLLESNIENRFSMVRRQIDISYNLPKFQIGIDISDKIVLSDKLQDIVNMSLAKTLTSQSFDYKNHINYSILQTNQHLRSCC